MVVSEPDPMTALARHVAIPPTRLQRVETPVLNSGRSLRESISRSMPRAP